MQNNWKRLVVVAATTAGMFVAGGLVSKAHAQDHKPNACGCYQKSDGTCVCGRPSKCGCPEQCEPKGCEEKRTKELDKEIQAETKKAEEAEKKRREEAAAKAKAEAQASEFPDNSDTDEFENAGAVAEEVPPAKDKVKKTKDKADKAEKADKKDKKDKSEKPDKKEAK